MKESIKNLINENMFINAKDSFDKTVYELVIDDEEKIFLNNSIKLIRIKSIKQEKHYLVLCFENKSTLSLKLIKLKDIEKLNYKYPNILK